MEANLTIEEICKMQRLRKGTSNKKRERATTKIQGCRNPVWQKEKHYKLIKKGKVLTERNIIEKFKNKELSLEMVYIFCHVDPYIKRLDNSCEKYIARFKCREEIANKKYFIKPKQPYLKQIYWERRDSSKVNDILKDGTPYWVDIYGYRVLRDYENKKRHQEKKKRLKK